MTGDLKIFLEYKEAYEVMNELAMEYFDEEGESKEYRAIIKAIIALEHKCDIWNPQEEMRL